MIGFNYQPPVISSIRLENLELSAQAASDNAEQIKTDVQGLHDLTLQYKNDAYTYFTQVQQFQAGDYVTSATFTNTLAAFSFADLASVPAEYTPSAHRHDYSELDNVPLTFAPSAHAHLWADITDKPVEFEPAEHVHTWQQIAEKPGTFPPEMHYHDWANIQNKPAVFNPSAHTHSWADVTGKPTAFTPVTHGHDWNEISNKPNVYHTGNSVNPLLHGIGGFGAAAPNSDLLQPLENGIYKTYSNTVGMSVSSGDTVIRTNYGSNNNGRLLALGLKELYYRAQNGVGEWGREKLIFDDGVFDYVRNDSGATVAAHGSVAGGDVSPAQQGTWRNVSGMAVASGAYGLFKKVV